jgi:hypothetical protein
MKDLEARWIQLPDEVRALYGQTYLEKKKVSIMFGNYSFVFVYCFWNSLIQED